MPKAPKKLTAADANRTVLKAINLWVWRICSDAIEVPKKPGKELADSSPFIKHVNKESDRLVKAIRAGVREAVRELPGRAQKGEVDRLMRAIAPKLEKVLR